MSNSYTMAGSGAAGIDLSTITIGEYKKFANKKLSINLHEAHGGYIVEIATSSHMQGDLYIIPDDKEIGQEIGKIITHKILKAND